MNRADEDDFRSFVASRSAALLWFAHLLTGDRGAAEDIVQTALAKTALGWSRVRRKDNPEAYVRRAIVNTHLNALRRRPWREQPQEHLPEDVDSRHREHELDDREAMWQALSGLPPRQRAVLVLRYYEDLSEADIADVLGCSRGTVKSQAAKGLQHLRRTMQKEDAST
ncbi:MAG TPA: SigE family RNA polymerase sigma factor [Acidothermaceae bacterium]|nr:SigE family RNA polymerase sigma factor [Acidothermaceae bacterium]